MVESPIDFVICGGWGGSNVGYSLFTGATAEGWRPAFCNTELGNSRFNLANKVFWKLARIGPYPSRLERSLFGYMKASPYLITTGMAPVRAPALRRLRKQGCVTLHYSTDDPWSRNHRAAWHHRAMTEYDIVYTPRRANELQLRKLGCRDVRYLPFGFDDLLFPNEGDKKSDVDVADTLFVGGADAERACFIRRFIAAGGDPFLVGGYWNRWPDIAPRWLGHCSPQRVLELTRSACVNLIMVRRSNRDGHTMRSIEAGAIGGCLLVEDTAEHRAIFGVDGECVRYFASPEQAASLAKDLLSEPNERARMTQAVKYKIRSGSYTYKDRLQTMLRDAAELRAMRQTA